MQGASAMVTVRGLLFLRLHRQHVGCNVGLLAWLRGVVYAEPRRPAAQRPSISGSR